MTTFVALIHKDADSDYGVSFPDLPGCVTAGSSIDEAISMAKEALSLHIEGMLEEGEEIPVPTDADSINRDDALLIAAIDVPDNLKVERVNITIPAITLMRIDSFAEQRGMTRSGLLVEAVQRWIAEEHATPEQNPTRWPPRYMHQRLELSAARELLSAANDPTEAALSAIQQALNIQIEAQKEVKPERASWFKDLLSRAVEVEEENKKRSGRAKK